MIVSFQMSGTASYPCMARASHSASKEQVLNVWMNEMDSIIQEVTL